MIRPASLLGWIIACSLGEALGIAVVSTTYAAIDRGMMSAPVAAILAAGAVEGACLGGFQWAVLRRFGVAAPRYVGATILAATIGYGLSLAAGAGMDTGGTGPAAEPPVTLILALGALMGAGLGPIMGAAQALAAAGHLGMRRWILANLVGWIPAMAIIMAAAGLVPAGLRLDQIAVIGFLSGALAGLAIGLATVRALPGSPPSQSA